MNGFRIIRTWLGFRAEEKLGRRKNGRQGLCDGSLEVVVTHRQLREPIQRFTVDRTSESARHDTFENLTGIVLQDWTDAVMAEQRSAAVRALAKKYKVKVTGKQ